LRRAGPAKESGLCLRSGSALVSRLCDYAILNIIQKVMPDLGVSREQTVFVSGIGCSSRFPYYMNNLWLS